MERDDVQPSTACHSQTPQLQSNMLKYQNVTTHSSISAAEKHEAMLVIFLLAGISQDVSWGSILMLRGNIPLFIWLEVPRSSHWRLLNPGLTWYVRSDRLPTKSKKKTLWKASKIEMDRPSWWPEARLKWCRWMRVSFCWRQSRRDPDDKDSHGIDHPQLPTSEVELVNTVQFMSMRRLEFFHCSKMPDV